MESEEPMKLWQPKVVTHPKSTLRLVQEDQEGKTTLNYLPTKFLTKPLKLTTEASSNTCHMDYYNTYVLYSQYYNSER